MAHVNADPPLYELDINILFEKFTVKEVKDIEKKTRLEIENKKEELRQMVGERYRDLIEAADTIKAMKDSVEKVVTSITSMEDYCKMLKDGHQMKYGKVHQSFDTNQKVFAENYYSISIQMRCLLRMPEKIWNALDSQNLLCATQLYLLAKNIYSNLQLDLTLFNGLPILHWFPVISHEWSTISPFRNTILQDCQKVFKCINPSEEVVCNSISAIMFLQDQTVYQAFTEFLEYKKAALLKSFGHTEHLSSIKDQICRVIQLVVTTLYHTFVMFYAGSNPRLPSNKLVITLDSITTSSQGQNLISENFSTNMKHFSPFILNFKPQLKTPPVSISEEKLQSGVNQWIESIIPILSDGISKLLNYITSLKALTSIRDAVWEILSNSPLLQNWKLICQSIMNRSFLIWEEIFRPLFLKQCKDIIQSQFESIFTNIKQYLKLLLEQSWSDRSSYSEFSQYAWTEHSGDLPFSAGWTSSDRSFQNNGLLIMKVKTYTPVIQNLCSIFDTKLKVFLEDFNCYILVEEKQLMESFEHSLDSGNLQSYLQTTCHTHVNNLLDFIDAVMNDYDKVLNCTDSSVNDICSRLNQIILLARFCSALSELSPSLQQCMNPSQESSSMTSLKRSTLSWHNQKVTDNPIWSLLKSNLFEKSQKCYHLWCNYTVEQMLHKFTEALLDCKPQAILNNLPMWDEVEIQEESEDGRTVTSVVRVPMQASRYVHILLFSLCQEINSIGGHSLSRVSLQPLISQTIAGILSAYIRLLNEQEKEIFPLNQLRALQLLFDLQFVIGLLGQKGEKQYDDQVQKITEKLEGFIDPFDFDVFTPHMKKRLVSHIQRCMVLLGPLTSLDKFYQNISLPNTQQKIHNLLAIVPSTSRFSLLPISTLSDKNSMGELNIPSFLPSPKSPLSQIPQDGNSTNVSLKSTSNSLYDKLEAFSSSWFRGQ